ncbi:MAG: hypothetical protein E7316_07785 [Clostridiales bacterium]|nr:hypothetical protein [Clostridiales bacterium]
MDRILLLMSAGAYHQADAALRSARENAAKPARLSYGLSLQVEPDGAAHAAMRALGSAQFLCPGGSSWADVEALWQGEGYVLLAHPAMTFTKNWDVRLLQALRQSHKGSLFSAVLTGYLPRRQDPVDAVCPVAAESFDAAGRLCFQRGTPLRYATAPQRSAFLHPDFCFAPAAFFREMRQESGPLFLSAFRRKWEIYTLHRPLIHISDDMTIEPCEIIPEEMDATALSRFEKRFGLRFATRQLTAMARQGVFTADLTFPTRVPYAVRAQETLRELLHRGGGVSPLCVTAYLSMPVEGPNMNEQYLCWFGYLSRLKNLSLLCYGDGETTRRIMPMHPNVLEFKRRYGLPVEGEIQPDETMNYIKLSKPFILARSREKFLNHSHYVWIDFGYLRYPVYERAAIDWSNICRDKIMLSLVEGVPDLSMLVVPDAMLLTLCREIAALCEGELNNRGHLPMETELWLMLIREHREWFDLIDLPGNRELLTLAMMNREEEAHVYS